MTTKKTSATTARTAKTAAQPGKTAAKPTARTVAKPVAKPAVKPAVKTVEEAAKTAMSAAEATAQQAATAARESAVKAATLAETTVAKTTAQAEEGRKIALKGYADLVGLQQEAFDAVMESGSIVAKGYEAIGKEFMSFTQSSLEANMAAAKAMLGAKSLQDLLSTQAGFARASLDKAMAESAKLGEMTVKLTSEAAAPIQARMNAAVESVTKQIAA